MSVLVACGCGQSFELRDEFRGRNVRCPHCATISLALDSRPADPVFGREVFLMRQKALAINEKYYVTDEAGQPVLFIVRPARFLRGLGALAGGFAAAFVVVFVLVQMAIVSGETGKAVIAGIMPLAMLVTFIGVAFSLAPKRHVTFYAGTDSSAPKVLEVRQDYKIEFPRRTFTILDADGNALARMRKNMLTNLFRKKWVVSAMNGRPLFWIKEDSIILSLLRRVLGPFFGLLRTNFVFLKIGSEHMLGEFKRKFTILDKYVLDMSADQARFVDRRLAVAAAVMLDTGERR